MTQKHQSKIVPTKKGKEHRKAAGLFPPRGATNVTHEADQRASLVACTRGARGKVPARGSRRAGAFPEPNGPPDST
eukprot:3390521-Amphidinium_carterae.1